MDRIDGEPTEFECNFFPGLNTLQLSDHVKILLYRLGETPENFTGRIPFVSMFNDISCGKNDNDIECLANAEVVSIYVKKFGIGQWSFIGPGSEKKLYSMKEDSPQGREYRAQDVVGIRRKRIARGWGPQGMSATGGGLARVPNLRVCKHHFSAGGTRREVKDELTSSRGSVQAAWQKPPVRREGGRAGLPAKR